MEPTYLALSLFRKRQYDKCIEVCSNILDNQPLDQAAWCLKMRALTQMIYVDDLETEGTTPDDILDENVVATAPRPETSLKSSATVSVPFSALSTRPRTSTGRPLSGVTRPGTHNTRPGSTLERLRTTRLGTQNSVKVIRLGTASMLSQKNGPFIQISRLNFAKYAKNKMINKPLFEYLFYNEGDVRNAMELAVLATQACEFKDWWWKVQLAKCYNAFNLLRDAEQQIRSALNQQKHLENYIRLVRIYIMLDQPLTAVAICKQGLEIFHNDVTIMTELARLNEGLNESLMSLKYYRSVLIADAMNTEAIACIGMYHFYNNQPELSMRYYRRVLTMGAHTAELYNNLGLCCLYSQQWDLVLVCFQRALKLAIDPVIKADVWYNLSYVGIATGDLDLAIQCLNLCLSVNSSHASACNNLAVLHNRTGKIHLTKAFLASAREHQSDMQEAVINSEILQDIWNNFNSK